MGSSDLTKQLKSFKMTEKMIERPLKIQRNVFPLEFKLNLIEQSKTSSCRALERKYGIGDGVVRHWIKNEAKIRALALENSKSDIRNRKLRARGSGRKTKNPELERLLHGWIIKRQKLGGRINKEITRKKALQIQSHLKGSNENYPELKF